MISATFHPAQPTVGDAITIDFAQPVTLDPSSAYEVVLRTPKRVVIRTFEPKPIALSGVAGDVRFTNLVVPVRSVLKAGEKLEPSPLKPPRELRSSSLPLILLACAAVAAIAAWLFAWWRARQHRAKPVAVLAPADEFRLAVQRARTAPQRWAALADATRAYLARRGFGAELTTSQLVARLPHERELITEILRRGDYEKFSPWGEPAGDFDAFASRAGEITDAYEPRMEEEAA